MTPRHPHAPDRRPPPGSGVGAILLLIVLVCVLVCGPGRAEASAVDSVSTPAADTSAPPAAAAPLGLHPPVGGVFRADRVIHASLAFAIGTGVGLSSREPAAGVGTVLVLAVAKELLDDRFDRGDLAAGAVGAGLAWLVAAALTR